MNKTILAGLVVLLVLSMALPSATALADGPKIPVPPKELPGDVPERWPVPPEIKMPELPFVPITPEMAKPAVGLTDSAAGVMFEWSTPWFVGTVLNFHWGYCGPWGFQYHTNIYLKRYWASSNQEAWLNLHLGTAYRCIFLWESKTNKDFGLCYGPPDVAKVEAWIYDRMNEVGAMHPVINYYIAYYAAILVVAVSYCLVFV